MTSKIVLPHNERRVIVDAEHLGMCIDDVDQLGVAFGGRQMRLIATFVRSSRAPSHEAGRYAEIGRQFSAVRDRMSRQVTPSSSRLQLALRFWRGWTQARDERWRASGAEPAVAVGDWPRYADHRV